MVHNMNRPIGKAMYAALEHKRRLHRMVHTAIIRSQFAHVGKGTLIDPTVHFETPEKIHISEGCEIRRFVTLNGRTERDIGIFLGRGVVIRAYTYIDCYDRNGFVYIDDFASIGQFIILGGNGGIRIGKYSMISGMCYIVSAKRHFDPSTNTPYNYQGETRTGVTIGDNVWIASQCMIVDGVTIGDNSVVGAGSVVLEDVPAGWLVAGIPARPIRQLG